MPFVCTPRIVNSSTSGSPQGVALQVTDLFPHKTQTNAALYPRFKGPATFYAHGRDITETVALNGAFDTTAEFKGLAAYILATIENAAGGGVALEAAQANNIAADIIAIMEGGGALTEDAINAEIADRTGGANGIGIGDSVATVLHILQIVSGYKVFTLPTGTSVGGDDGVYNFDDAGLAAMFTDPTDVASLWSDFSNTFYVSARNGQIKKAQTRRDAAGDLVPFVVCYADDGTLIQ